MINTTDSGKLTTLIKTFGPLSVDEIKAYFLKTQNDNPGKTEALIKNMSRKRQIFIESDLVKLFPEEPFDKKMIVAFWVFIAFAEKAGSNFFKTRYPSQIGFSTDDGVFIITVCDDKYHDKEMISLREKEEEYAENIVVGINLEVEDISESILPEKAFAYAKFDALNIIKDVPKIKFKKVKNREHR